MLTSICVMIEWQKIQALLKLLLMCSTPFAQQERSTPFAQACMKIHDKYGIQMQHGYNE